MATVQLRHFDYVLPVGNLAAGTTKNAVPLQMDNDADFILRGRAVHYQSNTPGLAGQSALTNYFDRITGPDSGDYLSQALLRFSNECPTFGQYGNPLPVRQPIIYPRGGQITVDVQNQGNVDFTNLMLYFRGQKIYPPGVVACNTYPADCSPFPFTYPGRSSITNAFGGLQEVPCVTLGQNQQILLNKLNIKNDADFVIRQLTIGSLNLDNPLSQYYQCFIQLRDSNQKGYSNLPVHVDVCFGAFGSVTSNTAPGTTVGPYHPGLLTPEIYLPANGWLYYDLYRQDNYINGAGGLAPVNLYLSFGGSKIFHRSGM